jgi:ribosomal protein S18 acetylase RimI-like enzyme
MHQMIKLHPMTEAEFELYEHHAINDFTRDGKPGTWPSASVAREQFDKLLPERLKTQNQHLLSIKDRNLHFGFLWLTVVHRPEGLEGFILDFLIFPEFRLQGHGLKAMLAAESYFQNLGVNAISLNVFPYNDAAKALYTKIGYLPTNIRMRKNLDAI